MKKREILQSKLSKKMLSISTIAVGEKIGMLCRGKKSTTFFGNINLYCKCPIKNFNINKILVL